MGIQGKEVLIVDDSADSRLIAKRFVETAGMVPIEAASADEARLILLDKNPHLILLDLKMDGETGFDLLEERRLKPELANTPVIVVSAFNDRDSVFRALALGANDYAIKPVTASVLIRKVKKALKDATFLSYSFEKEKRPKIEIHFQAEVTRPAETEFYVESLLKIAPKTPLKLHPDAVKELGLKDCVFVVEGQPNVRGQNGTYLTRVNVLGLSKSVSRLVKKARAS